jgi:hypothetical protein
LCRRAKFGKCIRNEKWDAKYRRLHAEIRALESELIEARGKQVETGHAA